MLNESAKSKQQFKYIWTMRNKYKSQEEAPDNMKWVFKKDWTHDVPFHDLPTKVKKKKKKKSKMKKKYENVITQFSDFLAPQKLNTDTDMNPLSKAWKKLTQKPHKEKIGKIMSKIDTTWAALLSEAGGIEGLKVGKVLGYKNFGNFTEACLKFVQAIPTALKEDTANGGYYQKMIEKVAHRVKSVTHVRKVSELTVSQFKFIRKEIDKLL